MDFSPVTSYYINRRIYNQRDFGQKYVKAYAYDPRNGETLLNGVEMVEKSTQGDFFYKWTLPDDVYGDGRQIVIWSVVYSDSGYTTRDINFGDEQHEIRIIAPKPVTSGRSVDYIRIEKMINSAISGIKQTDLKELEDLIKETRDKILKSISSIDIKETDISPIISAIGSLKQFEKTDLTPVINAIESIVIPELDKTDILECLNMLEKKDSLDHSDMGNLINLLNKIYQSLQEQIKNVAPKRMVIIEENALKTNIEKSFKDDRKLREQVEKTIFEISDKINEKIS